MCVEVTQPVSCPHGLTLLQEVTKKQIEALFLLLDRRGWHPSEALIGDSIH